MPTTTSRKPSARPERRRRRELPAKLICPQPVDAIARPRLYRSLDRLLRNPVTWIHAPAGAGKSTLVATYLEVRAVPVLFYEVDAGDADVNALFHYLRLGAEALAGKRLQLPTPRPGPPEAQRIFARRFFDALFAQLPRGTIIVFDNYQEAAGGAAWNEAFRELCAALVARVRLLVASRSPPPVELMRLGASGALATLDFCALRFDRNEIRACLRAYVRREARARGQSGSGSEALLALTDGWAVAVTLLARRAATDARLEQEPLAEASAEELEAVFGFLAEEILKRLDPSVRDLLLQVALLPSFTAEMASALSGRADARALLARVHREHLLIERHGAHDFRLHDLFRMFLRERARVVFGDEAWRTLAVRAARLLADNDQFQSAVDLLVAAESWAALADLVERQAPVLARQGRLATLALALAALPASQEVDRPWLTYWIGFTELGRAPERARQLGEQAFEQFRAREDGPGSWLAWALVVQAIALAREDFHPLSNWLARRRELGPPPPVPDIATTVAHALLVAGINREPDAPLSGELAEQALTLAEQHGSDEDRALIGAGAALLHMFGGDCVRALELHRAARARGRTSDQLARVGQLFFEGLLGLYCSDFDAAARAVNEGLSIARAIGVDIWDCDLRGVAAFCALTRRDLATTEQHLDAMQAATAVRTALGRGFHAYVRGWWAFERGDLESALRWNHESIVSARNLGFRVGLRSSGVAEVVYRAAMGDRAAVRDALRTLDDVLGPNPSHFFTTLANMARAYAQLAVGEDAHATLRAALGEARRLALSVPVYLGPSTIARLVAAAFEHDIEPEVAHKLMLAYGLYPGPEAIVLGVGPWSVKIRALGPLQLEVDGRPLRFGRKTPAGVLALLKALVAFGEPVSAERLARAVWPGYGGSAPRGTLNTAVYRLRRMLGVPQAIAAEDGRVGLDDRHVWTDTRALIEHCRRIEALADAPRPAVERCERILFDLYRGPLAADDDAPAIARAREQLRRRFGDAVARLETLWDELRMPERKLALRERAHGRDPQARLALRT